jgi:hypothetical protein
MKLISWSWEGKPYRGGTLVLISNDFCPHTATIMRPDIPPPKPSRGLSSYVQEYYARAIMIIESKGRPHWMPPFQIKIDGTPSP